ncbi:serine/threonine protein kinase [Neomicrococcus lactis]|uniref:serine/threonine protein kinase n=1 Tax=Neomicrococcus lactis TaxID=732241 RepID=UPI0023002BFA|nr:serine/threonine-protein kinase [Neomicrococcus lactis]
MPSHEPEPKFTVTPLATATNPARRAASSSSLPLVPGYRLSELIGTGSVSKVYLAEDVRTAAPLALKIFEDDDAGERFAALERESLGGVEHAHVVRLLGTATAETVDSSDLPVNILEYLPGGSALGVVRSLGPQSVGQTSAIVVPIAAAVAHLHGMGRVHGDVSPHNVLFGADGTPKLIDGSASQRTGYRQFDAGTAGFHAPEAVTPQVLQPERDVYSLGALIWFLLTGRVPSLTSHRPALSVIIRGVNTDLVNLVEACLDEDPAARPNAGDVARRLLKIAKPEPVDITVTADHHAVPYVKTRHHFDRALIRRRARRRTIKMWVSVGVSAVLTGAGVMMMLAAPANSAPQPSVDQPAAAQTEPHQPVAAAGSQDGLVDQLFALAAARDQALMDQDDAALEAIHADDSRSLRQDRTTVATLVEGKLRYEELSTSLQNVEVTTLAPAGKATVRAESVTKPFTVRNLGDNSQYHIETMPVQEVEFTLVKEGERWQLSDVALLHERSGT